MRKYKKSFKKCNKMKIKQDKRNHNKNVAKKSDKMKKIFKKVQQDENDGKDATKPTM